MQALDRAFHTLGAIFVLLVGLLVLAVSPTAYDEGIVNACSDLADRYPETQQYGPDWRGFPDGYVCIFWRGDGTKIAEHELGLLP